MNWLTWLILLALVLNLGLLLWVLARVRPAQDDGDTTQKLLSSSYERLERELREEVSRSAQGTRVELSNALGMFQQTLLNQQGDVARTQNEQIDSFRTQLAAMQTAVSQALQAAAGAQTTQAQASREAQDVALKRFSDAMSEQLRSLSEANERRIAEVRTTVEQRLTTLQQGNEQKLEQMRATVDEKLHATLEARLGESFKQVADRLEQVHKGLGEMQTLARDVGSLSRVLNNVKTRGTLGEVQLAGLLEQVLTPEQYERNVETIPGSRTFVDFAIKLPGRRDDGLPVWLPIDCKFPRDDYERLLEAHERADKEGVDQASKAIETRLRAEARTIREKYIATPHTTDFGILFVPTEGLYAEALRRPGLVEALQREYRITLAGPTTLLATLTSLQMGFRTLALEKRSAEVWEVLGAVKNEFEKFGQVLVKTKKKLEEAKGSIENIETRSRVMQRSLKKVESLPDSSAQVLLPGLDADAAELAADDEETA
jgi:DNA recombination protein RmuC